MGGRIAWMSPSGHSILGVPPRAEPALLDLVHPEDRRAVEEGVATAEAGGAWRAEARLRHFASLTSVYAHLHLFPIPAMSGIGLIARDRTHEAASAPLPLQEGLLRAQRMEAIGRLAGGVAHDFNNLLSVIIGQAEIARARAASGADLLGSLEAILEAARRSARLTQQLMIFGGRDLARPDVLAINEVVAEVASLVRRTVHASVSVEVVLDAAAGAFRLARSRAEQVLMNLAVNALDAMPEGGRLTFATRSVPAGGGRPEEVEVTVADTGTGIPEDVQRVMFEPFFSTKGPGRGTGLGLSVVHTIVTEAGGAIRVDSAAGAGTRIHVRFPATAESGFVDPPSEPIAGRGRGERVLVVDDEPAVGGTTATVLREWGYRVELEANGADALARLDGGAEYDLLVIDVVMPGMLGPELARRWARARPRARFLFVSGHPDEQLHASLERGDFLPKPYTPEDLARSVRVALDRVSP